MAYLKNEDSGLMGILQAGIAGDRYPLRALLKHTVHQVPEKELTAYLHAEPYTRMVTRRGYRNGYKPRTLKPWIGWLDLLVPKDREGRFRTELFEKYQRNGKALVLAVTEIYVQNVSIRKGAASKRSPGQAKGSFIFREITRKNIFVTHCPYYGCAR